MIANFIRIILALLLMAAPAWAEPVSFTGTVTYRERIALPAGAQLRVTLVNIPSGRPVAGASASIPAKGQVPLSFALNVRTALTGNAYGLVADIQRAGQTLFRNPDPHPVDTAAAMPIEIVVRSIPQAPAEPLPTLPSGLIDGVWKVTSIGGRPVAGERPVTLSIAADQRAGGHSGCNNYFAEASITRSAIAFGPAASTRMACAPVLMVQEDAYFAALAAVASFQLEGTTLRLLDAAGIPLIGLVRDKE